MENRPFWREPMVWLIAGLPLAAVVAAFATLWIANRNIDPHVTEGFQKQGLAITEAAPKPSH